MVFNFRRVFARGTYPLALSCEQFCWNHPKKRSKNFPVTATPNTTNNSSHYKAVYQQFLFNRIVIYKYQTKIFETLKRLGIPSKWSQIKMKAALSKSLLPNNPKLKDFQSSALNNEEKPYFPEEETHQCLICLLFSPIVPQERLYWAKVSICIPNNTPQPPGAIVLSQR